MRAVPFSRSIHCLSLVTWMRFLVLEIGLGVLFWGLQAPSVVLQDQVHAVSLSTSTFWMPLATHAC